MADSIADLLQDAARLHRDRALEEACGRYRQVLQGEPEHAQALYQRAVALEPNSIGDLLNLGTALHRVGRHEDAIASFDRALALHSGFPEAHLNRGNVLAHLGCYEEALASFDRVLAVNRRQLDALGARARALIALDR